MSLKQAINPAPTESNRDPRPALILLIVLCFIFISTYVGRLAERAQVNAETARLEARIARATTHHAELEAQKTYADSRAFLDKKARESLGLVEPGDEMLVVTASAAPPLTAELPSPLASRALAAQKPIWQQWVDLFVAPAL